MYILYILLIPAVSLSVYHILLRAHVCVIPFHLLANARGTVMHARDHESNDDNVDDAPWCWVKRK